MQQKHFRDLAADAVQRVECRHWFLKDHANLAAADFSHAFVVGVQQILTLEPDMTANDFSCRLGQQSHDRHRGHALATARLADNTHRAACGD